MEHMCMSMCTSFSSFHFKTSSLLSFIVAKAPRGPNPPWDMWESCQWVSPKDLSVKVVKDLFLVIYWPWYPLWPVELSVPPLHGLSWWYCSAQWDLDSVCRREICTYNAMPVRKRKAHWEPSGLPLKTGNALNNLRWFHPGTTNLKKERIPVV